MQFPAEKTARGRLELVAFCLCLSSLLACCLIAIHSAWRWPMVGDASLIHYVVFLMHSGRAPYSQIVEINLPGSYLLEYLAMHVFGWGAHGLRLYDGFLCVALCCAAYLLGNRNRRGSLFCLAGGMVFVLVHLQDGLDQAGQRDFALAVLILFALGVLIRPARPGVVAIFFYELLIGFTLTIKPTLAPFALLPLIVSSSIDAKNVEDKAKLLLASLAGIGTPVVLAALWLWHFHCVRSFVEVMRTIGVLHSELGRKSFGFLLAHCTSPVVVLFVLCVCALVAGRLAVGKAEKLLACGVGLGLLSYLDQGKGFPYQRYPFLAVALVFAFLVFSRASSLEGLAYAFSLAGLLYASLWLAPRFTASVRSFDAVSPFQEALGRDLLAAGGA